MTRERESAIDLLARIRAKEAATPSGGDQPDPITEPLDAVTAKNVDAPSASDLASATDEALRLLWLYGQEAASRAAQLEIKRRKQEASR